MKKKAPAKKKPARKHPPIPNGVRPGWGSIKIKRENPYYARLGVGPTTPFVDNDPEHSKAFITGFMVLGLAILCFTAYKLAELFATPMVCP